MKGFSDKYVESLIRKTIKRTMTSKDAALKLGITKQYMNRLRNRYLDEGIACLTHGNRGKQRSWKTDSSTEQKIVSLYREKYQGFNFSHFCEKLNEVEGIQISYGPLYRILTEAGIRSPKHQHDRKICDIHPTRPRRECFGELLQADASLHRWFGERFPKATLHGSIDDSSGTVMGLFLDREETLWGYYNMLRQILLKYGIPEAFYTDNRSIFEFRMLSAGKQAEDKDIRTQFGRCCRQLGIEIITTSTPQAKGRIERLWGTLQSRLVAELTIRNITDIEAANAFLPEFMEDFNRRFALEPDKRKSLFVSAPSEQEIDWYLSIRHERIIDNGSAFTFHGSKMQLVDENGKVLRITKGTVVDVYETFGKCIVAVHESKLYETTVAVPDPRKPTEPVPKTKPEWKPSANHPWKRYVSAYMAKKNKNSGGN